MIPISGSATNKCGVWPWSNKGAVLPDRIDPPADCTAGEVAAATDVHAPYWPTGIVPNIAERRIAERKRRHWFADLKAEALARWVRRTADQRLQLIIRGPFRGVLLWLIFRTIRQRAQPDRRVNAIVEFKIAGRRDGGVDCYRLALTGGRARRSRTAGEPPAVTLELEPVAFLQLTGGTASPQRLLLARKLKLHGDLMLALDLPTALGLPRRSPRHVI